MPLTKEEKGRYMASREWALKKRALRERSGGKCERCWIGPYEQTHHLNYDNLGNEPLEDLLAVCRICHEFVSAAGETDIVDPQAIVFGNTGSIADRLREAARNLPSNEDALTDFNSLLQSAILASEKEPHVVAELLTIKQEANRRLYDIKKGLRFL